MARTKSPQFIPDPIFSFDDTAIVMFNTNMMNHEFAAKLNDALQLKLTRIDDIPIEDAVYPCFSCYDDETRLAFVLIERSPFGDSDPTFGPYEKMLLIRGRDAWDIQKQLYDAFLNNISEPNSDDIYEHRMWNQLHYFTSGIFDMATIRFNSPNGPETSLYQGVPDKMPARTETYIKNLKKYLTILFEQIQSYVVDFEDYSM